jgi:murein DD-endopeptidase MepM/ murein hydrolase activator NlpD
MSVCKKLLPVFFFLIIAPLLFPDEHVHTLKKGETLYRIARTYDLPVDVLVRFNAIADPSLLREGTKIRIPASRTVEKGDTLYSIARGAGVSLESLLSMNGIDPSATLKIGQTLYIPPAETRPQNAPPEAVASIPERGSESGTGLLWPHAGERRSLSGKISGILIRGRKGDEIVSVSSGRVVWVGPYRGFGRVVFVESTGGYIYVYAGNETTPVQVGERIEKGTVVGLLGTDAHEHVPQLLFLVYRNGVPVDPVQAPRI